MIRLASLTAFMAVLASSSLSAMEVLPQSGGLVVGNDNAKSSSFSWHGGLANKQMDQGWARSQDAVFQTGGTARYWGVGLTLDGAFAAGQDRGGTYLQNDDPTTYDSRPIKPGELIQVNAKLDFLFQIDGVYGEGIPFLQLIPHLEKVTYPNQPANVLKDDQLWAGSDLWLSAPFEALEGFEVGGSADWNLSDPAFRGAAGFRELLQYAPYDLVLWQVANFGSRSYRNYFTDTQSTGFTTTQVGGKVTTPLAWREWWGYVGADWTYWVKTQDRDFRKLYGQDAGELAFTVGVEWRAE